ncbi:protein LOW PSII ACCUMULATION 1, chloroplastic [Telopea speciosissima]|uniref:protein LOW PSII ACCUMULATION 1, chloroplastic n=1 Tax=Telopea speciosissima TaxID=54955 RepID=UPI001CC7CFBB|nr:protein LOW PSII ACCUMULATION 1, chloroplastic [Telopea speciosissima]
MRGLALTPCGLVFRVPLVSMAAVAHLSCVIACPSFHQNGSLLSRQIPIHRNSTTSVHRTYRILHKSTSIIIVRSAANDSSSPEISSTAKIRSEVLSPFRTLRMFFYLAFIASSGLGGLIATTQLIAALTKAAEVSEIVKGLGIDIGALSIFAFLYSRENSAKNAQLARLSREESLSNLKLRVDQKKVISVSSLRGIARLVILAGPASFITESFRLSEPFTERLLDRGVLVVPFAMDGDVPRFEFEESEELKGLTTKRKRLWQLVPLYVSEWSKWLDEQKKLAKVSIESPVYISLRMDGRVRGSGIGYPPWNAFVAQLPPVKGLWSGVLDGMDGRVL